MTALLFELQETEREARELLAFAIEAEHDAELAVEEARSALVDARAKRRRMTQALTDALDAIDGDAVATG
jgi:hypothetical protein